MINSQELLLSARKDRYFDATFSKESKSAARLEIFQLSVA